MAIDLSVVRTAAGVQVKPLRGPLEVDHTCVELQGGSWGPRLKVNIEVTVPHALDYLEEGRAARSKNGGRAAIRVGKQIKGRSSIDRLG